MGINQLLGLAVGLGLIASATTAQTSRIAPYEVRARYGDLVRSRELDNLMAPLGWTYFLGAIVAPDAWRADSRAITAYRQLDLILIIGKKQDKDVSGAAGFPVWKIEDAVQVAGLDENAAVAIDCKVGTRGAFTPGLIAIVPANVQVEDDGDSALNGPALMTWHIDRVTGRFEVESLPVYCNDHDYGSEGE